MADKFDFTAFLPFDQSTLQDGFKTYARYSERFAGIAFDTAKNSNDIAAKANADLLGNLRELAVIREEPTEYGEAFTTFVQKQADLTSRTLDAYAGLFRNAQSETTELAGEVGETLGDTAVANANTAAKRTTTAAKKAAA